MPQEVMAFWPYDRYPYCLCGTVTEYRDKGLVCTKEYGPGRYFKPIVIVPHAEGMTIKDRLDNLEKQYRLAKAKIDYEYNFQAMKAAFFLNI
jgi:hypothetical protein